MNSLHDGAVTRTALELFNVSRELFWALLPIAFLVSILFIYATGEMTGGRFENLFRRLLIAIALFVAFPQISNLIQGMGEHLTAAFGGEQSISQVFSKVGDRAKEIKDAGTFSWLALGEVGLSVIATISFLILSIIQHFLSVLQLVTWNLLNILGPLALLGCLFPSWSNVPKGIFIGMLELSLWRPVWVILARILIAIGFGETPADPANWFDTAIMNFAVAGLMAATPALVHGFLSGSLGSIGGSTMQSMLSGAGGMLTQLPMRAMQSGVGFAKRHTIDRGTKAVTSAIRQKVFPYHEKPKPARTPPPHSRPSGQRPQSAPKNTPPKKGS